MKLLPRESSTQLTVLGAATVLAAFVISQIYGVRAVNFLLVVLLALAPFPVVHLLAKPAIAAKRLPPRGDATEEKSKAPETEATQPHPTAVAKVAEVLFHLMSGAILSIIVVVLFAFYGDL